MIEVKNLYKSFEEHSPEGQVTTKEVLKDICTTFKDGITNLIIGQSGSGKTVLMKNLVGLLDPTSGQVLYDGRDFVNMTKQEKVLITQSVKEVNQIMANYVGIVRSDLRLHRAWDRLDMLYEETERLFKRVKASKDICELRNMINVGYLITRWALERKECRGLHFTTDYPVHAYDKE